jgi:hypothetical protein
MKLFTTSNNRVINLDAIEEFFPPELNSGKILGGARFFSGVFVNLFFEDFAEISRQMNLQYQDKELVERNK